MSLELKGLIDNTEMKYINTNNILAGYDGIRLLTWPTSIAGLRLVPTSITMSVRRTCSHKFTPKKRYNDEKKKQY